ncbi:hypothetical protein MB02_04415 [Croceicoccus estronivorus]|uniref:hypothetical protein n=1 Tax=Croceicoccus estronivorus TaxID=1172626 RepID=UPI0008371AE2|nr:hypothetical protein [Croceicoccus estronivorus]OCC24727.1 hypothetical protein MB02_04415 [Croceicoccus estronivorus]
MNGPVEWLAAIGTMIAAGLIATDTGRKTTGWGFVLFCLVSATWVVTGLVDHALPIAAMNAMLFLINVWGVWQYLLSPKNRRKLKRLEELEEQAEEDVENGQA